ncbi:hypothetical protein CV102_13435 [Natronococcus pandeyae]|uniref:Uncharacterized protein n=1 Tax=Natronococcus pandeyae TaxID=2055836 RepID=A0A8J8TPW2_9EURY|nr:hypothetical protein [Natronococcus pandeyae]TYL38196.1 hypothetical protein CV102_13435 [Natronococcus pandeyae]
MGYEDGGGSVSRTKNRLQRVLVVSTVGTLAFLGAGIFEFVPRSIGVPGVVVGFGAMLTSKSQLDSDTEVTLQSYLVELFTYGLAVFTIAAAASVFVFTFDLVPARLGLQASLGGIGGMMACLIAIRLVEYMGGNT